MLRKIKIMGGGSGVVQVFGLTKKEEALCVAEIRVTMLAITLFFVTSHLSLPCV